MPTKETMALVAAIGARKLAAIARDLGVTPGAVSQWKQGVRPVPADKAVQLGRLLGVDPRAISASYADVVTQDGALALAPPAEESLRPDLVIRRLENDIDSLRIALASLVSAMRVHRPAEARDVAKVLRKQAPAKFVRQGYIRELLEALES